MKTLLKVLKGAQHIKIAPYDFGKVHRGKNHNGIGCAGVHIVKKKTIRYRASNTLLVEGKRKFTNLGHFKEIWDAICARKSSEVL